MSTDLEYKFNRKKKRRPDPLVTFNPQFTQ